MNIRKARQVAKAFIGQQNGNGDSNVNVALAQDAFDRLSQSDTIHIASDTALRRGLWRTGRVSLS